MKCVALLRGVNVGGNNKVEMSRLKQLFEQLGNSQVKTYINSGNVIFDSPLDDIGSITPTIEQAMVAEFGFSIKALVVKADTILNVAKNIPADWVNDSTTMRCDIIFLWPEIDSPEVINQIKHTPNIDELAYYPGTVAWKIWRKDYTRSGLHKFIGTQVYKKSTARNINTVRKLAEMIQPQE